MTAAGHCSAQRRSNRRRKRALVGLVLGAASLVAVDSVQIPTYRSAQEPDASPYGSDDGIAGNNDTDDAMTSDEEEAKAPRMPRHKNDYKEFMTWCTQVLGIQTSLEIKDFSYPDFMMINMATEDDDDDELCDQAEQEFPPVSVRGLAATQDIQVGVSIIVLLLRSYLSVPVADG